MKLLVPLLVLSIIGCSNGEPIPALASPAPYDMPMAELPIELRVVVPSKTFEDTRWEQLSSDFYTQEEL